MTDWRIKRLFYFLFLALTFINTHSQISNTLYLKIPKHYRPEKREKITLEEKRIIIKQAHDYAKPSDKAIVSELDAMAVELENQAKKTNNNVIKVKNYSTLGDYYQYFKDRENSLGLWVPFYKLVLKNSKNCSLFEKEVAYAHIGIGIFQVEQSKYEEASLNFDKSLQIFTKRRDTIGISSVHSFLHPLYTSIHLYEKAIEEQNLMLKYLTIDEKKKGLDKFFTHENYQDKALTYIAWYESSKNKSYFDSASTYIDKAITIGAEESRWKPFNYFLIGYRNFLMGDYKSALINIDLSLLLDEFYTEMNSTKLVYKGICLLKLGRRYEGKKILLNSSIGNKEHDLKAIANDALFKDALAHKEYAEAIRYLEMATKYKDFNALLAQRGKIFEAKQKYSVIAKEVEIKNLEIINVKRQKQRNSIILIFIVSAISLLTIIIVLYNRGRERKFKALEAEALLDKERRKMEDIVKLQERDIQRVRKKAIYNLRKKISRDMHDELTSALAGLKYYVNDLRLKETENQKKNLLETIELEVESVYIQARTYMHNLYTGIEEVVGNLNPFLQNISNDLSKNKNLNINLKYDKLEVESKLSTIQQNQLTLILKEAMSNILKHSGATNIEIMITFRENECHFSITDNGMGFDNSLHEKGIGMESMELRIKRIKGKTSIFSSKSGTIIQGSFRL